MKDRQQILEELGYQLTDHGLFWSSNAVYRGGDNPKALQIYKDSGVWKDYVEDTDFLPFEALIEKTIGSSDKLSVKRLLDGLTDAPVTSKPKLLNEERVYPESCLKKLLPHFDFYTNRGENSISRNVLTDYKCGLATGGKLFRRIVFPIFREDGVIHGFSGRTVINSDIKWLHKGRATNWFYPYFSVAKCREAIQKTRTVFIVESIGDSLALANAGFYNSLVSFGLSLSPHFIAKLCSLDLDRVIICFNNDAESKKNNGLIGSIKQCVKLVDCMDFNKIYLIPPTKNDFGVMTPTEIQEFVGSALKIRHEETTHHILNFINENIDNPKCKKFVPAWKKYRKTHKFHYEF